MAITGKDRREYAALELRINTILPEEYQDRYDDVQPVSMGSAGLKFNADGKVAWDDIWDTFCDLAMAGGPPHKGKLLEPATAAEIDARPRQYRLVVDEICRGIRMVTDLAVNPSPVPGWVRVHCESEGMAGWLVRAIVMENVSAHAEGPLLDLPAGPSWRLEKEIKNVITVIAKTCHYWSGHMWTAQQRIIAELFASMSQETALIQPAVSGHDPLPDDESRRTLALKIQATTGLPPHDHSSPGWLGVNCPDIRSAIWMMRALVVKNVLARREETVLFVPVNPRTDPEGEALVQALATVHRFAKARGIL